MATSPNTLTVLVPTLIAAIQRVLRNTGAMLNAAAVDATAAVAALGQTVNLPASFAPAPYDVTPAAVPPTITGCTPTANTMTLDKYRGAAFSLTGEDWRAMADRGPDFRIRQIDECIAVLIDEMSAYLWAKLYKGSAFALGAAATNPFASNPNFVMDAWKLLADSKAPDMGRLAVYGTSEWAQAGKLSQFQKMLEAPEGTSFARGRIGMLGDFLSTYDQVIQSVADSGATGFLVNNVGGYAAGTTTLVIDTGAGTIIAGDVVKFAGHATLYVVKSATATALVLNASLTAAVADDEAITVTADARRNILCHPDAAVMAIRPPAEAPDGDAADMVQIVRDPVTGVSLRLAHYKGYHAGQWELSAVWGGAVRRPTLSVVVLG